MKGGVGGDAQRPKGAGGPPAGPIKADIAEAPPREVASGALAGIRSIARKAGPSGQPLWMKRSPMKRPTGQLSVQIERWTQQTLSSGRFLVHLYRRLQDDKQAAKALEVMGPSEERARRLGLPLPQDPAPRDLPDETEAEAQAWERLLEAQIGFCSFHAMVAGPRGAKRTAERAYFKSMQGFETAFPAEWVALRRQAVLDQVATLCADLFLRDLGEEGSPEERVELHHVIESGIRQGFAQAKG